jgi:hypothetical protein
MELRALMSEDNQPEDPAGLLSAHFHGACFSD